MLAGMFVGLGILLIFTIGGLLSASGFAGTKIVMGISFGIALSLVIMAGPELFTGNNFVITIGMYQRKTTLADSVKLWIFCWFGNLTGSVITAVLFTQSGLNSGAVAEFIAATTLTKTNLPVGTLTLGNMIGGILFVALPYAITAGKEPVKQ